MELSKLVETLPEKKVLGDRDREISGLAYDSRETRPGFLFAAIRGTKLDGKAFVEDALARGASAILTEAPIPNLRVPQIVVSNVREALASLASMFYGNPTSRLKLVGVTGTNGKTSTTYLCESLLSEAGYRTGVVGTIQYKIGDRVLPCKNTTPESVDLFQLFHQMVESGVGACAMEVSSHALDQGRVSGVLFDVAVFTNLTQDHLDYHKTMDAYFEAKAKLFTPYPPKRTRAVVNADDPYGRALLEAAKIPWLSYGIESGEIRAKSVELGWKGISFTAATPRGEFSVRVPLAGKFNVYNTLAAVGVGLSLDLPAEVIARGLEKVSPVRGRFELVEKGQNFAILIDYAHTPNGLENLLQSARELTRGRLVAVFGCGGDRDRGKRPIMGKIAGDLADVVILTSDNPRSEEPLAIIKEIEAGVIKPYRVEPDRKKAIALALSMAGSGDCVVIAGKGHENYQIFKDQTIHFDDREVVEEFLGENSGAHKRS